MDTFPISGGGARRPSPRRWRARAAAAAIVGAIALGACSHGPHRGWHEGVTSGSMDPERAARHADRMAERLVSAVDGNAEQTQRIRAIARAAIEDLAPLREQARTARRDGVALLSAATVDRGAIEALRAKQVGLADDASKRLARALADAAEVLTPEQRARLAERIERRAGRWS